MRGRRDRGPRRREFDEEKVWLPKTKLGDQVMKGEVKDINEILEKGQVILEPEIVDHLLPKADQELVYIGGSPGKGGGIKRTPTKRTARMHKSGRRYTLSAMVAIGNGDGVLGIGGATSKDNRTALEKAEKEAKINVIRIRRGCGGWECGCGGTHSIPFKTRGKSGSVRVILFPAPKGVGIVGSDPIKKILKLAGIKDIWVDASGDTGARENFMKALFQALKNLNRTKGGL